MCVEIIDTYHHTLLVHLQDSGCLDAWRQKARDALAAGKEPEDLVTDDGEIADSSFEAFMRDCEYHATIDVTVGMRHIVTWLDEPVEAPFTPASTICTDREGRGCEPVWHVLGEASLDFVENLE